MQNVAIVGASSEPEFAAMVDALAADPERRGQLTELLREDHPLYEQRGASAVVRMRGWVLLALARAGLPDSALVYVLEELDAGTDAYLVAAAARALRTYPNPGPALAPFVARALGVIRYHDEPLSFESYGEYAVASSDTSSVRELLATLEWLGPHARAALPEVEALRAQRRSFSRKRLGDIDRAIEAMRGDGRTRPTGEDACCTLPAGLGDAFSWARGSRREAGEVEEIVFEDQDGAPVKFGDFLRGQPSIVVFFYTRCDNPLKCSLTVAKLARVQKLLEGRGLAGLIRTAAITYDPAFDLPHRLRAYGLNRGVRIDAGHRLLRATGGLGALRRHFKLGVNFVESLVNRHRIELYILDPEGRVAASFERIRWDEERVVEQAAEVLGEGRDRTEAERPAGPTALPAPRKASVTSLGTLVSLGVAFFPKCPICWAGYLSLFGVAGLQRIPYYPWLQPLLIVLMLINVGSVWLRGRATGRMSGFYLVGAGAVTILASKVGPGWEGAAVWGVALTLAGSVLSVLGAGRDRSLRGSVAAIFR